MVFLTLKPRAMLRVLLHPIHATSVPCKNFQPKIVVRKSVLSRLPNDCVTVGMHLCMAPQVVSVIHLPHGHILMIVTQYQTLGILERWPLIRKEDV